MKLIESLTLRLRANKYKTKHDRGGIHYIHSVVKQGQTVLDIGAHKAGYLYFFQKLVGSKGHVYAFEPQSALYQYISRLKSNFHWDNVNIEHLALSDSEGTVTLYIPVNKVKQDTSPGATIVGDKLNLNTMRTEQVKTEMLDAYCLRHKIQPAFLKIDVEGNELRIFKGGAATLQQYKPKILVEIEARHIGQEKVRETLAFMESLGYAGSFIHGMDRKPVASFSFDKYQNTDDMVNYCNNFVFE